MKQPLVSVLMSVHNGAAYLKEAIDSILIQSLHDYEFIIIEDGSSDDSLAIIKSYSDERIRLIVHPVQIGLAASLNEGMVMCNAPFIARMDADDISLPDRLEKQLKYMQSHHETGILGTAHRIIGSDEVYYTPMDSQRIRIKLLQGPALSHPTVMLNKALMQAHSLAYNTALPYAQDYELWIRASKCLTIENLAEPLLLYRRHDAQASSAKLAEQDAIADRLRLQQIHDLGIPISQHQAALHIALMKGYLPVGLDKALFLAAKDWMALLMMHNDKKGIYDPELLFDFVQNIMRLNIINSIRGQSFKTILKIIASRGYAPFFPTPSRVRILYHWWKGRD